MRILIMLLMFSYRVHAGFYDDRYRGWYWFEEKEDEVIKEKAISSEVASSIVRQSQRELENAKNIMMAQPNVANVRNYMITQNKMFAGATKLEQAWRETLWRYPELVNRLENPQNVHAVKFQRKMKAKQDEADIRAFAQHHDLILVMNSGCPYSKEFAPTLAAFGKYYGFKIEALSVDGGKSKHFKTSFDLELLSNMNLNAVPTVVTIINGEPSIVIEGYASHEELEEAILMKIKIMRQG